MGVMMLFADPDTCKGAGSAEGVNCNSEDRFAAWLADGERKKEMEIDGKMEKRERVPTFGGARPSFESSPAGPSGEGGTRARPP
jgi:hypothetical protein